MQITDRGCRTLPRSEGLVPAPCPNLPNALIVAAGGVVSSTLASIALWRGWGRR